MSEEINQSTFEAHPDVDAKGWTAIPNELVRNGNIISDAALRVLIYLLSNRESWKVYKSKIKKDLCWGREKLDKAIKELEESGRLLRTPVRNEKNQFSHDKFMFSVEPIFKDVPKKKPINSKKVADDGFSDVGSSDIEKPASTNTNSTNTNKTSCSVQEGGVPPLSSEKRERSFSKKNAKGEFLKFDESEVFTFALKSHPDWTTEEIEYCLDAAWKCKGPINSMKGFLEGTIKKYRNKQNFEKMESAKCLKKEESQPKNTSSEEEKKAPVKSSDKPMSPDMLKQLFPGCC